MVWLSVCTNQSGCYGADAFATLLRTVDYFCRCTFPTVKDSCAVSDEAENSCMSSYSCVFALSSKPCSPTRTHATMKKTVLMVATSEE